MDAYIIAGQSNALGISPVSGLRDNIPFHDIYVYSSCNVFTKKNDKLLKMGCGFGADENKFGLEVGIAKTLQENNVKALLIKYASDGTSLYDRWNAKKCGEDFKSLLRTVDRAEIAFKDKYNEKIDIQGIFWMQGSSDSLFFEQANEYYENLKDFICELRSRYGKKLPFVIGQTNPNNKRLIYVKTVNAAQKKLSEEMESVIFVNTEDLNSLIDDFHYDAENMLMLGCRMAEALLKR